MWFLETHSKVGVLRIEAGQWDRLCYLTRLFRTTATFILVALLIGQLLACSVVTPPSPMHIVVTKNVGKGWISDVVIDYGAPIIFRDETPMRPGTQHSDGGDRPIPQTRLVTWKTADNSAHKAAVSLRSKITFSEKLRAIELWFADEKLEVYHSTATGDRGEYTNHRRIYP